LFFAWKIRPPEPQVKKRTRVLVLRIFLMSIDTRARIVALTGSGPGPYTNGVNFRKP
jgi:hypothetical protein